MWTKNPIYNLMLKLSGLFLLLTLLSGCTHSATTTALSGVTLVSGSARESDGSVVITARLSGPSTIATTADLKIFDSTAKAGVDFLAPSSSTFQFAAGSVSATIAIPILNDQVLRSNKQFNISLTNPHGLSVDGQISSITLINDNLAPEADFQVSQEAVSKTAGQTSLTVELSAPAPETFQIGYSVTGTSTFGIDHSFASGFLTISAGQTTGVISGALVNTLAVTTNKTIVFSLLPTSGLFIGAQSVSTLVIANGSASTIAVLSNTPSGTTNVRNLNITVVGYDVTQYKYKVVSGTICSADGYSDNISTSIPISDAVSNSPDGAMSICVLGGNAIGSFQSSLAPTIASWVKSSAAPSDPLFTMLTTSAYQVSSGSVLSNVATPSLQFSGLTSGYKIVLYNSLNCNEANRIGSTAVSAQIQQVSANLVGDGKYALAAAVFDQYSVKSNCVPAIPIYTLDTAMPAVIGVSSTATSGIYSTGASFPIKVTFSKQIRVSGTPGLMPYLLLNTAPASGRANYVGSSLDSIVMNFISTTGSDTALLDYSSQSALYSSSAIIRDLAGNLANLSLPLPGTSGRLSSNVSILVDTTSPTPVGHFSDGDWGKASQAPTFTWVSTFDLGGSGVSKYQIAIGSIQGGTDTLDWTDVSASALSFSPVVSLIGNNTYFGSIRAIDFAGNISQATLGDGFVVDNAPPTAPVITLSSTKTFDLSQSPTVSWTASLDAVSGFDHYEIALGTSSGATDVSNWQSVGVGRGFTYSYNGSYNTNYFASVRAFDRAGNFITSHAEPYLLAKPNLNPNPVVQFAAKKDVELGAISNSLKVTIAGLDLPITVSVDSPTGDAKLVVNDHLPITSAIISNGDVLQITMKASVYAGVTERATMHFPETTATWDLTPWSCPTNYVFVPAIGNSGNNFCVSKYQIASAGASGSEIGVSAPSSQPTRGDEAYAARACGNNGQGYALITNNQWEAIGKNIEGVDSNWSGGKSGVGELSGGVINSAVYTTDLPTASPNDSNACYGASGVSCDQNTWSRYRRTMTLSTGAKIWDMTGLNWQWVGDSANVVDFLNSDGSNPAGYYCPNGTSNDCYFNIGDVTKVDLKLNYGPGGTYLGLFPYSFSPLKSWGGIGEIVDTHPYVVNVTTPSVFIYRGGSRGDEDAGFWHGGIFSAKLTPAPFNYYPTIRVSRPTYYVPIPEADTASATLTSTGSGYYSSGDIPNPAGGFGTKWTGTYYINAGTYDSAGPDYALSQCVSDASCIAQYAFGTNCSVDPNQPTNTATTGFVGSAGTLLYYNVWSVTCSVISSTPTLHQGATDGTARCTYKHPIPAN